MPPQRPRSTSRGAGRGRRASTIVRRRFSAEDLDEATLVFAATDDRAVNAAVVEAARAAGRLVNVADAPGDGDFVTASTHRTGDLVIAVAGGGVPAAAARVRDLIAGRVDDRYGTAIGELAALRGRLLARGDRAAWRGAAAELIGPDFARDVESGELTRRVRAWA